MKRASRSASLAKRSGSTLIATSRFSFVSRARYTSPMPPAPREERISYGPRRAPGLRAKRLARVYGQGGAPTALLLGGAAVYASAITFFAGQREEPTLIKSARPTRQRRTIAPSRRRLVRRRRAIRQSISVDRGEEYGGVDQETPTWGRLTGAIVEDSIPACYRVPSPARTGIRRPLLSIRVCPRRITKHWATRY